jgi:hypothetical protein
MPSTDSVDVGVDVHVDVVVDGGSGKQDLRTDNPGTSVKGVGCRMWYPSVLPQIPDTRFLDQAGWRPSSVRPRNESRRPEPASLPKAGTIDGPGARTFAEREARGGCPNLRLAGASVVPSGARKAATI